MWAPYNYMNGTWKKGLVFRVNDDFVKIMNIKDFVFESWKTYRYNNRLI